MKNINALLKKYNSISIVVKAGIWLTACSLIQKGISVITVPIFTRLLTPEQYGLVSVFVSWCNIIILVTGISLHTGVFNTAMIKYEGMHNKIVSSFLGLITLITSVVFFIYLVFRESINKWMGMSTVLVLLIFLKILLAPAYNLWMSQQRFEYHYKPFIVITLAIAVLVPLVGYICVVHAKDRALARIISMTVIECIFYGGIYIYIFIKGKKFFDIKLWKYGLLFNIPLVPHFLSGQILNQADRIMIHKLVGTAEAGIYSVGYSAAMLLQIIVSSIMSSIIPWQYKKMKCKDTTGIAEMANITSILMASACFIFSLLAPEFIRILATKEYTEAMGMLPPLTVSIYFFFIYNFFVNIELYYEKNIWVTLASCLIALLNIVLNFIAITIYGYMAAAYTTLICYVAYALIHYIFMKKILKNNQLANIYNTKFLLFLSVIMLFISVFLKYIYDYTWIRLTILALFCIGCILNYRKILHYFKIIREEGQVNDDM